MDRDSSYPLSVSIDRSLSAVWCSYHHVGCWDHEKQIYSGRNMISNPCWVVFVLSPSLRRCTLSKRIMPELLLLHATSYSLMLVRNDHRVKLHYDRPFLRHSLIYFSANLISSLQTYHQRESFAVSKTCPLGPAHVLNA